MSEDEFLQAQAYWELVGQVTPVLALALVVEARAMVQAIYASVPAKRFILAVLSFPLFWFTFSIPYALDVVGGSKAPHTWARDVNSWVITVTIGLLLLTRVRMLTLGAWAEPVSRIIVRFWRPNARNARNLRHGRRSMRRQIRRLHIFDRNLEEVAARLADMEVDMLQDPAPETPQWQETTQLCRKMQKEVRLERRKCENLIASLEGWIVRSLQAKADYRQMDAERRILLAQALARELHSFGTGVLLPEPSTATPVRGGQISD